MPGNTLSPYLEGEHLEENSSEVVEVEPDSPIAFADKVLGVTLWEKQKEVLSALTLHRRVAVKAGNGLGKGFCAAVAVLWFIHHHDPAIALTTAPTFRQVRHVLWRQIRRLYRPASGKLGGAMLDTRWELYDDRYAMGLSASTADQFQGFHGDNLLIVVDEAEGVSEEIYEAIEAVMTSPEPRLLLIGNPTTVSGGFRRAFYEERSLYFTITISALESPNFQEQANPWPGLTTREWVDEHKETWGEDSPIYQSRVMGEFPEQEENTLIRLTHLEAAASRDPVTVEGDDEVVLAVDVARFGSDRSVILRRRGFQVEEIRVFRNMDTVELAGWVVAAIKEVKPARTYVDEVGVGAGLVDQLKKEGYQVHGVNVARAARQKRVFGNLRAEGFWRLRELLARGLISIPYDNQLISELSSLRFRYDENGRVFIESKDQMRSRGLPSPDKADALMLAFLEVLPKAKFWA